VKQIDFINGCLLAVGERDFMTGTLTSAPQRRAYKIFKDTFTSFTHECVWSFLNKVGGATSWSVNVATVPQYQQMISVVVGERKLTPIFNTELLRLNQGNEGHVIYFCLQDNTTVSFYNKPSTTDKAQIRFQYVEELLLPTYDSNAVIPFTYDFVNVMENLMQAKLCLQMLDDQGGYQSFMREYGVRLGKAIQKDQRITRSRPNMFRGGRL
jgi:hypothetical protein